MKAAGLLCLILSGAIFGTAIAQVPQGIQLQRSSFTIYRDTPEGKKVDFVITGTSTTNMNSRSVIDQFEMKSYHNGDPKALQIIAQAPQCEVDSSNNASDAGPLQVFTPTTNLFVQGVGFRFTPANHFLIISNQVETRVLKSLVKSSVLSTPRTNSAGQAQQFIKIFADHGEFNFDSNVVDYSGHVHMIDSQLDLTSDLLTIRFTTNGAVESMLALHNVVLTTPNNGRATGATGFYYVTNKNEMMQLTGNAKWRNGSEEADAEDFTYDSERHILNGIGHVRVRWPNATAKSDLIPTVPLSAGTGTNGYRELFADFATMKFPPTNGPVESMYAHGHVIIVNQADQSRAMAERAEYHRTTDRVELAGSPAWWTDAMRVEGDTLTAELDNKTYHARKNAHFKMRMGAGGANQPATGAGHPTNQWVYISSYDMEYQTNQANFYGAVETRFMENGQVQYTLDDALLTINLTNGVVESAFARGNVHGETAPDTNGIVKTITCQALNAYRDVKTALMKSIDAHTNVLIEERGGVLTNRLAADTVTAQFSPVTNRIDQAVAIHNVVIDQIKSGRVVHATADHAVYTAGTNDEVKLTGAPLAHKDNFIITDSDYMVWQPKANTFQAFGRYKIVSVKQPAQK